MEPKSRFRIFSSLHLIKQMIDIKPMANANIHNPIRENEKVTLWPRGLVNRIIAGVEIVGHKEVIRG